MLNCLLAVSLICATVGAPLDHVINKKQGHNASQAKPLLIQVHDIETYLYYQASGSECPGGYLAIAGANFETPLKALIRCKNAASALYSTVRVREKTNNIKYQSGCFRGKTNNKVYFNNGESEKPTSKRGSICYKPCGDRTRAVGTNANGRCVPIVSHISLLGKAGQETERVVEGCPLVRAAGDGYCDPRNNVAGCWDGGDCCPKTCKKNSHPEKLNYDCSTLNCQDPAQAVTCDSETEIEFQGKCCKYENMNWAIKDEDSECCEHGAVENVGGKGICPPDTSCYDGVLGLEWNCLFCEADNVGKACKTSEPKVFGKPKVNVVGVCAANYTCAQVTCDSQTEIEFQGKCCKYENMNWANTDEDSECCEHGAVENVGGEGICPPPVWYCVVTIKYGVTAKTFEETIAQAFLRNGSKFDRQAIIPMRNTEFVVDWFKSPNLKKTWTTGPNGGGSMWWYGLDDIDSMQKKCEGTTPPEEYEDDEEED